MVARGHLSSPPNRPCGSSSGSRASSSRRRDRDVRQLDATRYTIGLAG
jgi:hypothetical protein